MNSRELAEYVRLDIEHPGWKLMSDADVQRQYWMYFRDRVARARLVASWRIAVAPLRAATDWLNSLLSRPSGSYAPLTWRGTLSRGVSPLANMPIPRAPGGLSAGGFCASDNTTPKIADTPDIRK